MPNPHFALAINTVAALTTNQDGLFTFAAVASTPGSSDTHGFLSGNSIQIRAGTGGLWLFTLTALWQTSASGTKQLMFKNLLASGIYRVTSKLVTVNNVNMYVSQLAHVADNDTVQPIYFTNVAGSIQAKENANQASWFTGVRLGDLP